MPLALVGIGDRREVGDEQHLVVPLPDQAVSLADDQRGERGLALSVAEVDHRGEDGAEPVALAGADVRAGLHRLDQVRVGDQAVVGRGGLGEDVVGSQRPLLEGDGS